MQKNIGVNKSGFTLVELIVVIVILGVLSTIGFVSYVGYLEGVRDTNRISQISNIQSGLEVLRSKDSFVLLPDADRVEVLASTGNILIYQGYAGENIINTINYSKSGKDPQSGQYYTYAVTSDKKHFQLMGFLEEQANVTSFNVHKVHATDYTDFYPYVAGDKIGILTQTGTNTPIQEIAAIKTAGSLNLATNSTDYITTATNTNASVRNGTTLLSLLNVQINILGKYPLTWNIIDQNCDKPDIIIGTQTWAGCNSTLGNGFEFGQIDANMGTSTYSGTVGHCYPLYNAVDSIPGCVIGDVSMNSTTKANTWFTGTNPNGDKEFDSIWGKFYKWENASSACGYGYHLPSDAEWEILEETLAGSNCRTGDGFQCAGLGWLNNGNGSRKLVEALEIPLSGYRNVDGISTNDRGSAVYLWSSTSNSNNAYIRYFLSSNTSVLRDDYSKNFSFAVRCIKD